MKKKKGRMTTDDRRGEKVRRRKEESAGIMLSAQTRVTGMTSLESFSKT